jgi:hypothetical protein
VESPVTGAWLQGPGYFREWIIPGIGSLGEDGDQNLPAGLSGKYDSGAAIMAIIAIVRLSLHELLAPKSWMGSQIDLEFRKIWRYFGNSA